jgi:hypothetical protein
MARILYLIDILELVHDGLNDRAFTQEQLIRHIEAAARVKQSNPLPLASGGKVPATV